MAVAPVSEQKYITEDRPANISIGESSIEGHHDLDASDLFQALESSSARGIDTIEKQQLIACSSQEAQNNEDFLEFSPPNLTKVGAIQQINETDASIIARFQAQSHQKHSLYNMGRSRFLPTSPADLASMGVGIGLYFRLIVSATFATLLVWSH